MPVQLVDDVVIVGPTGGECILSIRCHCHTLGSGWRVILTGEGNTRNCCFGIVGERALDIDNRATVGPVVGNQDALSVQGPCGCEQKGLNSGNIGADQNLGGLSFWIALAGEIDIDDGEGIAFKIDEMTFSSSLSTQAWILVVKPPRERPGACLPFFLAAPAAC